MRTIKCPICSAENTANVRNCIRCHNPLPPQAEADTIINGNAGLKHQKTMPDVSDSSYNLTHRENEADINKSEIIHRETRLDLNTEVLRKTQSDDDYRENLKNEQMNTDSRACKKCNYPLRSGEFICPNCNADNAEQVVMANKETQKSNLDRTRSIETILDLSQSKEHQFKLSLLKGGKSLVFEGEKNILNRANLDHKNPSISKEAHATISFKDNKWVLEDMSSNGATFIQLTQPTELKNGSLIIIGNVIYRFEVIDENSAK
jgi:uncharacterized Zn finger protein (UPF0148 family)